MKKHSYEPVDQIPLETLSPERSYPELGSPQAGTFARVSRTSELFDELDRVTQFKQSEDNFESDPRFRSELDRLKGLRGFTQFSAAIVSAIAIAFWVAFLIYYSSTDSRKHALEIWHGPKTNIVSLDGQNVTLNDFSPHKTNLTLAKYRSGSLFSLDKPLQWLLPSQFPSTHTSLARGFYLLWETLGCKIKQVDTEYEKVLLESSQFNYGGKFFYADDFVLNPNASVDDIDTWHLIRSNLVVQWRHSFFSHYWIWKPVTGEITPITPNVAEDDLPLLHFAQFSPSGKQIAFGHNHDLYLLDIETMQVTTITTNGNPDIYNGKPDWVYEEEVYPRDRMIWWSPDLRRLAFVSLNDTNVKHYDLDYYVKGIDEVAMSYEDLEKVPSEVGKYPLRTSIRYPRPGTPNPTAKLYTFEVALSKNTEVLGISDEVISQDFILYDATWLNSDNLMVKVTDRTSSVLQKKLYSPLSSKTAELISTENSKDYDGWIEKAQPILVVKSDKETKYLDRVVADNLVQLAVFDDARSKNYSRLLGPVNLASPLALDPDEDFVYGLFGTNLHNTFAKKSLSESKAETYLHNISAEIHFSPDRLFADIRYKGPKQPWQKVVRLSDLDENPQIIDDVVPINDYNGYKKTISEMNMPTKIRRKVTVGHGETQVNLNMIEILPPKFDIKKKYPLLVHAYGGPGSTTVDNAHETDFQDVISSSLNAIVLIIDPRGTGSDDWKIKAYANRKIGFWGPRDLTYIVSDYIKKNSFIDSEKTALWGWSYGAFLTLKTLESDKGKTFKYGMAVAPVTNWMFYDSIYTERYMGSPSENTNYESVSRLNNYDDFKGVQRFLIMHGTADDNVHIQNTLWLLDQFDKAEVENYDVHFFPDSDHSIYYNNANTIIYDKLLWWLEKAFQGIYV